MLRGWVRRERGACRQQSADENASGGGSRHGGPVSAGVGLVSELAGAMGDATIKNRLRPNVAPGERMPLEPPRTAVRTHCRREMKRPGAWAGNDLGDLGCGGVLEGMRDYGGCGEWPGER